jgi:hypothetical protein
MSARSRPDLGDAASGRDEVGFALELRDDQLPNIGIIVRDESTTLDGSGEALIK